MTQGPCHFTLLHNIESQKQRLCNNAIHQLKKAKLFGIASLPGMVLTVAIVWEDAIGGYHSVSALHIPALEQDQ